MGELIYLNMVTRLNLPPDRVLEEAIGKFSESGVVIMGWTKDDELYFASSIADGGTVLWLLETCKKRLLTSPQET